MGLGRVRVVAGERPEQAELCQPWEGFGILF